MNIHVHSVVRDAEYLMPYFLRHYTQFADVYLIDDHSEDRTVEIAQKYPNVHIETYPYGGKHKEREHSAALEDSYKEHSRKAQWVMCVDQDEFIYHENIQYVLKATKDTLLKPQAYMMISEKQPDTDGQIYDEVKIGVRTPKFDKPVIFRPTLDITFSDGRHSVVSTVEPQETEILLLHYKYLSREYYVERANKDYPRWDGMDEGMMKYRIERGLRWYDENIKRSDRVI